MSTQEYVVVPTDQPPIAFQGRVVARASGPTDDPKLSGRHHEITVYETDSGDLHLAFEFKSECEEETDHCYVERRICVEEFSDVLMAYDATEYLNRDRLDHRQENTINQFLKRLHQQYYDLCTSIEQQMAIYQPLVPVATTSEGDESNRPGWRSWLPFGKPR